MGKPGAAIRAAGWVTVGAIAAGGVATAATTTGGNSKPSRDDRDHDRHHPAATPPAAAAAKGKRGGQWPGGQAEGPPAARAVHREGKDGKPDDRRRAARHRRTRSAPRRSRSPARTASSHTYVVDLEHPRSRRWQEGRDQRREDRPGRRRCSPRSTAARRPRKSSSSAPPRPQRADAFTTRRWLGTKWCPASDTLASGGR